MMDEIDALLAAEPLPDDAEERLGALLRQLPDDVADGIEPMCFEALAQRRLRDTPGALPE